MNPDYTKPAFVVKSEFAGMLLDVGYIAARTINAPHAFLHTRKSDDLCAWNRNRTARERSVRCIHIHSRLCPNCFGVRKHRTENKPEQHSKTNRNHVSRSHWPNPPKEDATSLASASIVENHGVCRVSKYWGVECKTCEEFLQIDEQEDESTISYLPPLEVVPCPACGSQYLYVSGDVVDEDGVALNPWPE